MMVTVTAGDQTLAASPEALLVFALKTPILDNRDPKGIIGNIGKYWEMLILR